MATAADALEAEAQVSVETVVRRVVGEGSGRAEPDRVAAEVPLEVRVAGRPFTVLMRTPGHDEELVRGLFFAEGIIATADDVVSIRPGQRRGRSRTGDVLELELAHGRGPRRGERSLYSNSSCGVCGKRSLASLELRGAPISSALSVGRGVLGRLPERLRAAQCGFQETGGTHASGLFSAQGDLLALREDVGRHNALDKLLGWALASGRIPLAEHVLCVSGRVSYELVQKSIAASIPLIAAVGAPSSLAVELCEQFGITLIGFLRAGRFNVYTHPQRVSDGP
jgi:FdhD protein